MPYTVVQVSKGSKRKADDEEDDVKHDPKRYENLSPDDQHRVDEWLDHIDMFYGKEKNPHVYGVSTSYSERREANLKYYEHVLSSLNAPTP